MRTIYLTNGGNGFISAVQVLTFENGSALVYAPMTAFTEAHMVLAGCVDKKGEIYYTQKDTQVLKNDDFSIFAELAEKFLQAQMQKVL